MEFMGRKMFAYLGYLYCRAEEWSTTVSVLSQIPVLWRMEYLERIEKVASLSDGIWFYSNSIVCNSFRDGEWTSFSFSLFLIKKISPLFFADITWILWSSDREDLCGMNEVLDLWMRRCMSGKSGCQYPERVTDMPDIFGLANDEFVPSPKRTHHSTKLKVTSDSSNN